VGPGSYTGIRVGVAAAKGLSFALNIPLIDICSLDIFIPASEGDFAVLFDAKVGGVYVKRGSKNGALIAHKNGASLVDLTQIEKELADVKYIVTPKSEPLKSKIHTHFMHLNKEWEECFPSSQHMLGLGLKKWKDGDYTVDKQVEILYLRKTQAEIEKEKRKAID
jgi:tRNA threonylcarbamoyladenosine biosynthesis protein TsaB